jgi:hypothetical protein
MLLLESILYHIYPGATRSLADVIIILDPNLGLNKYIAHHATIIENHPVQIYGRLETMLPWHNFFIHVHKFSADHVKAYAILTSVLLFDFTS